MAEIRDDLLRLASMDDAQIENAVKALADRNCGLAKQVSADDDALNTIRYDLEEKAYGVIATQQPNGSDLRFLVGAVSVATNLERIGDHAAGIARLVIRMCDQSLVKPLIDIPQMTLICRDMVRVSLDAYLKRDVELAMQVVVKDDIVNDLHNRVYRDLLAIMMKDAATIERATYLLWVSHNLERIGDRAKNICERAIYLATGELKEFVEHLH
jgi:phosphate transport system protein